MCTVVLLYRQVEDYPIIIAQNRDALADSVESPPSNLTSDGRVFGPRELKSRGTWIGVNQAGLVCALTNRYQPDRENYRANMSRGQLVLNVLEHAEDCDEALKQVLDISCARTLKYFNLFLATAEGIRKLEYASHINAVRLGAGRYYHSSSGYDAGAISEQRERRLHELLDDFKPVSLADCLTTVEAACRDHYQPNLPSETAICMHGTHRRTTSSTLFAIHRNGNYRDFVCEQAGGYPCQNQYRRFPIGQNWDSLSPDIW
jgi:hypothetical protein